MGSSPRVRGTLRWRRGGWIRPGIIPACAGNTTWISSLRSMARDHPRVCGEHKSVCTPPTSCSGSSPRVRGTLLRHEGLKILAGIIPACAGNTHCSPCQKTSGRDHPRVCGEHIAVIHPLTHGRGSSPRVRGTLDAGFAGLVQVGIIPACAGNTIAPSVGRVSSRDHPRVCGEHRLPKARAQPASGSSPRVRGTQRLFRHHEFPYGIIPACAGNTNGTNYFYVKNRDHPRVCGEHFWDMVPSVPLPGSSPRVRGTRGTRIAGFHRNGIIPACAGNT